MKNALQDKDIMSPTALGTKLGKSRQTVVQMAEQKIIPGKKTGKGKKAHWIFYWPAVRDALSGKSEATK